jgi:hypothetical protein
MSWTAEDLEYAMTKLLMAGAAIITLNVGLAKAEGYPAAVRHSGAKAAHHVYVSNGSFDWRRQRNDQHVPWYAYNESGHCYVWTPNAYHYACDPNSRY